MQNKSNICPLKELSISLDAIWTDSSLNSSERKKKKTDTDLNKLIATIHRASRLKPITENRKSTPLDSCRFLGLCKLRDKRKINYMLWCETDEEINNSAE